MTRGVQLWVKNYHIVSFSGIIHHIYRREGKVMVQTCNYRKSKQGRGAGLLLTYTHRRQCSTRTNSSSQPTRYIMMGKRIKESKAWLYFTQVDADAPCYKGRHRHDYLSTHLAKEHDTQTKRWTAFVCPSRASSSMPIPGL